MRKEMCVIILAAWIITLAIARDDSVQRKMPSELTYYTVPAISSVKRLSDTFPEDGVLGGTLQIIAAKNEFEPVSFVVFSPEDIKKAKLKVSKLKGKAGTIPAGNVDLKIVKCWYQGGTAWHSYFADPTGPVMVPELLLNDEKLIRVDTNTKDNYLRVDYPKGTDYLWISNRHSVNIPFNAETTPVADAKTLQSFELEAEKFKQFWVTVKIPADAEAGIYHGEIKLTPGELSIPISVRVLPFELPKPMTNYDETREFYTIVYNSPNYRGIFEASGADKAHADKKMLAIYENMRDHNIRHPICPDFEDSKNALKAPGIRQLEILRDSGCSTDPLFGAFPSYPPPQWLKSVVNVPLADQKLPRSFTDMVDDNYEFVKKMFGHTNIYCFGRDEPPKWRVVAERLPWKYIHDKGLKIISTGKDSHLDYSGYNEDFINCPGEPSREQAAKWHAVGARIANYAAPHTGPENPDFMRRVHGLQLFHANFDGIGNYIITCRSWDDFRGKTYSNYRQFSMTYPTQDGVIDTIGWEGIREAVDDVRYATKLKQLARRAIATGKTESVYAGRQALQWLDLLDMKSVDLNTTRLEMIDRILSLNKFEDGNTASKSQIKSVKSPKENAEAAAALIAAGQKAKAEPKGVEKWKAVLDDKNTSAEKYSEALFKLIESLAVKGKMDDAAATAETAASNAELSVADQFTAKLIRAGIDVGDNTGSLTEKAAETAESFNKNDLSPAVKEEAYNNAAKIFMVTRQYALVRKFSSLVNALYGEDLKHIYECRYVDKAPTSVEGWMASDIVKDPKNREARFVPYNSKAAASLFLDMNAERNVGDENTVADKGTAFYMTYDSDGWSLFIECEDSEAENVKVGLTSGGSLEMYMAPGDEECYYQWFVNPGSNTTTSTAEWSPPHRHHRPMNPYWKSDVNTIENGIGVYVFIPWELVYDKLPANGDKWPFNIIRWSRAGGMTWRGRVHNIHDFNLVRWNGLTDETLLAIKRKIVLKGLAKYRKSKNTVVAHWSDEVLGDSAFYKQALIPAIERLDAMAEKISDTITPENITMLYEQAVPDWMEFEYLVSELRREYLMERLLANTL